MSEPTATPTTEQIRYRVTFAGVGRSKVGWVEVLKQKPTERILERLVKKQKVLMSRDIECVFDDDEEYGEILAGIRPVGAFRVECLKVDSEPFSADHVAIAFAGLE